MMAVTVATTVMTMTALSIDRYHAVVHPMRSKGYRTPRRTSAILLLIWLINILTLVPVAIISRTVPFWSFGSEHDFCVEYFDNSTKKKVYTLALFTMFYSIPLLVIGLSYYLMAKKLWKSVSPGFLQDNTAKALRSRRRVSTMVLVIVAVFAVCWLPIHCVQLQSDFGTTTMNTEYHGVIKIVAHVLSYMNSAVNPIIYGFMSMNFRQSFKMVFSGFCKRNTNREINNVFVLNHTDVLGTSNSSGSNSESRRQGTANGQASRCEVRNRVSLKVTMKVKTSRDFQMDSEM